MELHYSDFIGAVQCDCYSAYDSLRVVVENRNTRRSTEKRTRSNSLLFKHAFFEPFSGQSTE